MKNIFMLIVVLSIFGTTSAMAADTNLYLGAKFGSVSYGYDNVSNNSQAGYGLIAGFSLNRVFAIEAEYNKLGGFDSNTGIIKGRVFGFSGIGFLPFSREFSLFGKMGISTSTLEDTAKPGVPGGDFTYNNTGLNIGFGGQFNVGDEVGFRFGFDFYPVGDSTVTTTSTANMMYIGTVLKF